MATVYVEIGKVASIINEPKKEIAIEDVVDTSDVLKRLMEKYPEFKKFAFDKNGKLRPDIILILNDRILHDVTRVRDGDRLKFLPVIAGG